MLDRSDRSKHVAPKSTRITVYTPEPLLRHPGALLREMLRDLIAGRELALQLASRDIRAQYRQTALGFLWALVMPVTHAAVWLFMQKAGVIAIRDTGMPYPVFVFTGTILWSIFIDAVNAPLQQVNTAKPMLAKINFPREALILSGICQTAFHSVIRIAVLLVATMLFGIAPGWIILLAPIAVIALILSGTTIGVLLIPLGLLYTDVGRALPLLMQFLMFLSPVVYPVPTAGLAATLLKWNPLTPLISCGRNLLVGNLPESFAPVALISVSMFAGLFAGWLAYRIAMPILIERMSA
jgi:lipopolysaccharide transport system permease protein